MYASIRTAVCLFRFVFLCTYLLPGSAGVLLALRKEHVDSTATTMFMCLVGGCNLVLTLAVLLQPQWRPPGPRVRGRGVPREHCLL